MTVGNIDVFPENSTLGVQEQPSIEDGPKEELLKSISSPLGDGARFPRPWKDPLHHRIRGDKEGSTFIPIEKPAEQSRRFYEYLHVRSRGDGSCVWVPAGVATGVVQPFRATSVPLPRAAEIIVRRLNHRR